MGPDLTLAAADGLLLRPDGDSGFRLWWGDEDWLGPIGLGAGDPPGALRIASAEPFAGEDALGRYAGWDLAWESLALPVLTTLRAYRERPLLVFRLEAGEPIAGFATGSFATPACIWPWLRPGRRDPAHAPAGLRGLGHQYTEFAFPTLSGPALDDFFLFPHRPAVCFPIWLNAADGRSLLLAPLDRFHEQVIGVPTRAAPDGGLRCGWHGDLDRVPAGFASELAVWAGPGPRGVTDEWAAHLRHAYATRRLPRDHDATVARLSYWTDNGATYWYRTEPGLDMAGTLEARLRELREQRVPVTCVELDSWFYPHQVPRAVGHENPAHVPPSGALTWEAREDVLPEGIESLRKRLGDPPLIVHARHWSSRSPYFEREPAWTDGDRAHPQDPEFFARRVERAHQWGALTVEQDWLVEIFLGVRGLREEPGRARAWQQAMDRAAGARDMSLLWCMATPADLLATLELERVVAVRTSGDYRYLSENPANWVRFLYTNALARALGLHPFKDVFLSNPEGEGLDGDPWAEAEALLSALSSGPVGLGDRLGRTRRDVVMRTCREDGVLVKPDEPIAALDRCLRRDAFFEPELLVGECGSRHGIGRTLYLAAFNAWREKQPLAVELAESDLGEAAPAGESIVYDWRTRGCERWSADRPLAFALGYGDWSLRVLCPLLHGRLALIGDLDRYATAGDARIASAGLDGGTLEVSLCGAPGERVALGLWSREALRAEALAGEVAAQALAPDASGLVSLDVGLDARGRAALRLR